ncbi:MAG TPA: nucleotidyltransferase domain-containing protein [Elusimicrobiales bacterium]|jgi:predicted nucleotidyltransferase|nr:nucleotidyltransferase domain-containing protein [Elusimicrobiales bacterium]HPO95551.1 nucleotidyltransferase domain-containing protein [Elusimicrobiales bacterium]
MNEKEAIEKIKNVILDECNKAGVEVLKIILFGSRARGDAKKDSDFDVYVVVKDIDFMVYKKLYSSLLWRFAEVGLDVDIVLRTKEVFDRNKEFLGYVSYYVNRDGVVLWMKS